MTAKSQQRAFLSTAITGKTIQSLDCSLKVAAHKALFVLFLKSCPEQELSSTDLTLLAGLRPSLLCGGCWPLFYSVCLNSKGQVMDLSPKST